MIERDDYQVPADAIEALARRLLPAIRSYFESEEGKAAFAEWKSRQDAKTQSAIIIAIALLSGGSPNISRINQLFGSGFLYSFASCRTAAAVLGSV